MNDAVANREFRCISPSDGQFTLSAQIGRPSRVCDEQWGCSVSLYPLLDRARVIYGVDSWQALQLATSFIHSQLRSFIERGGQLFFAGDSSEAFTIDDFPGCKEQGT